MVVATHIAPSPPAPLVTLLEEMIFLENKRIYLYYLPVHLLCLEKYSSLLDLQFAPGHSLLTLPFQPGLLFCTFLHSILAVLTLQSFSFTQTFSFLFTVGSFPVFTLLDTLICFTLKWIYTCPNRMFPTAAL